MHKRLLLGVILAVLVACGDQDLYAEETLTLMPGEARRVELILSASAVKDSYLSLNVDNLVGDLPEATLRVVPDDGALPVLEGDRLDLFYPDLTVRCQRRGDCRLGFTLENPSLDASVSFELRAHASRSSYDVDESLVMVIEE